jgi:16S rRNA (adenine1518-N6/adenine1519-N6)-dimethyltransferase
VSRQRWGQHFLRSGATARRLVERAGVEPGDVVIEVGPGAGALTGALLERGARVIAVEIDARLADALPAALGFPKDLRVIAADATSVDFDALLSTWLVPGAGARAVANLPYESATAILLRLLDVPKLTLVAVVVQREVAERIAAPPGARAYGYLSVLCQDIAEAAVVQRLPPGAFDPAPRVESAMVRMRRRAIPLRGDLSLASFRACVSALCGQPRKTVRNNLRAWLDGGRVGAEEVLARARVDGTRRPGALPVAAFAAICRAAADLGGAPSVGEPRPAAAARRSRGGPS